jgi:hypothetical protein
MTTIVTELYTALRKAGIDAETARAAAKSVMAIEDKEQLATKADINDLRVAIAELKADLTWRILLALSVQTAVFSAIVAALKFVKP